MKRRGIVMRTICTENPWTPERAALIPLPLSLVSLKAELADYNISRLVMQLQMSLADDQI
ncbi:hypothetical protein PILCRDRAFT_816866, partial [Piloderma croceum F 1598]